MHFFTSITANYIPKARVLAESVKIHNPGAVFYVMLCDSIPDSLNLSTEPFDVIIELKDLGIDSLDSWIFKHTVVELCTAVKGSAFKWIFDNTDAEKVVYLDPDIVVLHKLDELERILDSLSIVITPHMVSPEETTEAILDNEICSLKHGVYNLGFLALKKDSIAENFLNWWIQRLLEYCFDDIPNGLFTDQRWIDLAPCFFDNILILRDKTYNVATWNLSQRLVGINENGKLVIERQPIKFFHFSGFDSGDQAVMLAKYAANIDPLLELRSWYVSELQGKGQSILGSIPCVHSFYSNGAPITDEARLVYRKRLDLQEAFPHPFQTSGGNSSFFSWFNTQWPIEKENNPGGDFWSRHRKTFPYLNRLARKLNDPRINRSGVHNFIYRGFCVVFRSALKREMVPKN